VDQELEEIERDAPARSRLLDYARAAEQPSVRVRLIDLARDVGWLSEAERRAELARMLREVLARPAIGAPEVDLACGLNQKHQLDGQYRGAPAGVDDVAHAAVRACLGSAEGRARTLQGLTSTSEADVRLAQVYLRHRPITDDAELRRMAQAIVGMEPGDAQVRALEVLARHYVADPEVLRLLTTLYSQTPSWAVQVAIAGILIRADRRSLATPQLVRDLVEHRKPAPQDGDGMIDALIGTLQPQ
jgi:hypothetical protein